MRLLLDTHVYLWWLSDDPRLPDGPRDAIADPAATVMVSAASLWEASIKQALGRLELEDLDLVDEVSASGFTHLAITARHAWAAGQLPAHHRDPFDRLLVAQARAEGLLLVTEDPVLSRYDVPLLQG